MANPVEVPKLGNTVEECLIAKWRKHKGERVSAGDVVAEIETDKATFEVTAPVDGTVLETFFDEGALVPVFTNLFVIGEAGESVDAFRPRGAATPKTAAATEVAAATTEAVACRGARGPGGRSPGRTLQPQGQAVCRGTRLPSGVGHRFRSRRQGSRRGSPQAVLLVAARLIPGEKAHRGGHGGWRRRLGDGRHGPLRRPRSAGHSHLRHPREDRAAHARVVVLHRAVYACTHRPTRAACSWCAPRSKLPPACRTSISTTW